jgi:hypothetical protein
MTASAVYRSLLAGYSLRMWPCCNIVPWERYSHFLFLTSNKVVSDVVACQTMSVRLVCVCISYFISTTLIITDGFNLNLRHALVFSDPEDQTGSYYGFTVALRKKELKHW